MLRTFKTNFEHQNHGLIYTKISNKSNQIEHPIIVMELVFFFSILFFIMKLSSTKFHYEEEHIYSKIPITWLKCCLSKLYLFLFLFPLQRQMMNFKKNEIYGLFHTNLECEGPEQINILKKSLNFFKKKNKFF